MQKSSTSEIRIGAFLLLSIASALCWLKINEDKTIPARISALEMEGANEPLKPTLVQAEPLKSAVADDNGVAISSDAVQGLRKMVEGLPTREYIDDQMNILRKQTKACGDLAVALKSILGTLTGSGITSLDVNQLKGLSAKIDDVNKRYDGLTNQFSVFLELPSKIDDVTKRDVGLTNQFNDFKNQLKEQQARVDAIRAKEQTNSSMIQQITSGVGKVLSTADVQSIVRTENTKVVSDVAAINKGLGNYVLQSDFDGLDQKVREAIQKSAAERQAETDGMRAQISTLESENKARINDVITLAGNQATLVKAYQSVKGIVKKLILKVDPSVADGELQDKR